jgi:hypothetical protein
MASQITYNSINISITVSRAGLSTDWVQKNFKNDSGSGKIETINLYGRQEYTFDAYFLSQIYYDLTAWWSWARQGKAWSFALDSANVSNTTLDAGAASGQKTIPLTATTALTAGDFCLIRAADSDDEFEVVEIASVSAGVSVTSVDNLKYTYASADTFRHLDYFPSVLTQDKSFSPKYTLIKSGTDKYYMKTFKFVEAL